LDPIHQDKINDDDQDEEDDGKPDLGQSVQVSGLQVQ
jgi:hypothetical protein